MYKVLIFIFSIFLKSGILVIEDFKLDIDPITPIYWINNNQIFVNEESRAFIYDIKNREIINEYEKNNLEVWGFNNDKIFICNAENKVRETIEDYSTHLTKSDLDENILLDIELKPTLEVVECREDIILKTVFPIEEQYFIFTKDLYELTEYKDISLSPNLRYSINVDNLEKYQVKIFSIRFDKILTLE